MTEAVKGYINKRITELSTFSGALKWEAVGGGSINETFRIITKKKCFFIKLNNLSVFPNGFIEEEKGLVFLQEHGLITPEIVEGGIYNKYAYLILKWVDAGAMNNNFWINLAEQLAGFHRIPGNLFGFDHTNYMGQLKQFNDWTPDFETFFINQRIQPQLKLAFDNQWISVNETRRFEGMFKQLSSILPKERPCPVHGDLWSGNMMSNSFEKAVFIDPAVHFGHRESDLAMTHLFGGFSHLFYTHYQELHPLEKGFQSRKDIYNLYPLLIHLNLFGSAYLSSIKNIVSKF